jgi:hypothetical protein
MTPPDVWTSTAVSPAATRRRSCTTAIADREVKDLLGQLRFVGLMTSAHQFFCEYVLAPLAEAPRIVGKLDLAGDARARGSPITVAKTRFDLSAPRSWPLSDKDSDVL